MQIDLNTMRGRRPGTGPGGEGEPEPQPQTQPPTTGVRIPFLRESIGLGDAIAGVTSLLGVKPCGKCDERRENLNRLNLTPWST
jgi:hypothetical protein